jgi:PST family polysaccharide transporter
VRVQAALGLVLFLSLLLLAPALAGWFRDPHLAGLLRLAAAIPLAYAAYAALVGFLNGRRRFAWQAGLDATFSTLKTLFVLGAAALGLGALGAVGGFAAAAWVALVVAVVVVRHEPRPEGTLPLGSYLGFGGWLVALTGLSSLVLSADLWLVKRLVEPALANHEAGVFRAALTLAQLLFQLLIPLSLVVFPSLARLGADAAEERRRVVRSALRYVLVALVPAATVLAAVGEEALALLYGASYRGGGGWLVALAPGYAAWTGAYLLATALAGVGRARIAVLVLATGLVAQVGLGVLLFEALGTAGIAAGDAIAMVLAMASGLVLASRVFGPILPWSALARALALSALLGTLAFFWPASGPWLLAKLVVLAAVGLASLTASGELEPLLLRWRERSRRPS